MRIDDVSDARHAEKASHVVRLLGREGDDSAAAEEAPELRLPRGTTHLSHDGGGRTWHGADLESHPMIGPDLSVVALGCDQHSGVVDNAHAERG